MALVFLPAADIPRFVGEGNVDLGITGQDMVAEASTSMAFPPSIPGTPFTNGHTDLSESHSASTSSLPPQQLSELIHQVLPLGFGKCKLQVQVPERSTDIKTVQDLVGKKVATSFDGLAGQFFNRLDETVNTQGGQGKKLKTKIEYVGGSVEAACALGLADGIVDLVGKSSHVPEFLCWKCHKPDLMHLAESGETMRAAGLHPIHTIMSSEAILIHARRPSPQHAALISKITARIRGVIAANKYVLCNYNVPRKHLEAVTQITPGRRAATVSPLEDQAWVAVSSMVEKANVANIMDQLEEQGACDILIIGIVSCYLLSLRDL